jgi:hypothetical protein
MDNTPEIKKIVSRLDDIEFAVEKMAYLIDLLCVGLPEGRSRASKEAMKIQRDFAKKRRKEK